MSRKSEVQDRSIRQLVKEADKALTDYLSGVIDPQELGDQLYNIGSELREVARPLPRATKEGETQ